MADLYVKSLDMINPFVVASSPATQGARNVLKSAKMRPGAIVLRNFGHGSGGGSFIGPDSKAMYGCASTVMQWEDRSRIASAPWSSIAKRYRRSREKWTVTLSSGFLWDITAILYVVETGKKSGPDRQKN